MLGGDSQSCTQERRHITWYIITTPCMEFEPMKSLAFVCKCRSNDFSVPYRCMWSSTSEMLVWCECDLNFLLECEIVVVAVKRKSRKWWSSGEKKKSVVEFTVIVCCPHQCLLLSASFLLINFWHYYHHYFSNEFVSMCVRFYVFSLTD